MPQCRRGTLEGTRGLRRIWAVTYLDIVLTMYLTTLMPCHRQGGLGQWVAARRGGSPLLLHLVATIYGRPPASPELAITTPFSSECEPTAITAAIAIRCETTKMTVGRRSFILRLFPE